MKAKEMLSCPPTVWIPHINEELHASFNMQYWGVWRVFCCFNTLSLWRVYWALPAEHWADKGAAEGSLSIEPELIRSLEWETRVQWPGPCSDQPLLTSQCVSNPSRLLDTVRDWDQCNPSGYRQLSTAKCYCNVQRWKEGTTSLWQTVPCRLFTDCQTLQVVLCVCSKFLPVPLQLNLTWDCPAYSTRHKSWFFRS